MVIKRKKLTYQEYLNYNFELIFYSSSDRSINEDSKKLTKDTFNTICSLDERFEDVSLDKFTVELRAIELELLSYALQLKYREQKSVLISSSTKVYLLNNKHSMVWKAMEGYNAAFYKGYLNWLESLGRINNSFWENMREDMASKIISEFSDRKMTNEDILARVILRIVFENAWDQGFSNKVTGFIPEMTVYTLFKHLDIDIDEATDKTVISIRNILKDLLQSKKEQLKKYRLSFE